MRALDRYQFSIRDGHLFLGNAVLGLGGRGHRRDGQIYKWSYAFPGVHVDGPESWLYPIQPPS